MLHSPVSIMESLRCATTSSGSAVIRAVADALADMGIIAAQTPSQGLETLAYRHDELTLAVPRQCSAAAAYVSDFVARKRAEGFIQTALVQSGQTDVIVGGRTD